MFSRSFHNIVRVRLLKHLPKRFNSSSGGDAIAGEGAFVRLWNYYSICLHKRPLLTKSVTSGVISISADLICQSFFTSSSSEDARDVVESDESEKSKFDLLRLGKFSFLGFALVGPTLHYWYGFLGRMTFPFSSQVAKTSLRLVLDQGVFTPIFVAVFMSSVIVLEQLGSVVTRSSAPLRSDSAVSSTSVSGSVAVEVPEEASLSTLALIKQRLSADYLATLKMNYTLWVPAMFANFYFIPLLYQTLFSNSVGLVWNIYLSWASYKSPAVGADSSKEK
jgi:hypothetical protein